MRSANSRTIGVTDNDRRSLTSFRVLSPKVKVSRAAIGKLLPHGYGSCWYRPLFSPACSAKSFQSMCTSHNGYVHSRGHHRSLARCVTLLRYQLADCISVLHHCPHVSRRDGDAKTLFGEYGTGTLSAIDWATCSGYADGQRDQAVVTHRKEPKIASSH